MCSLYIDHVEDGQNLSLRNTILFLIKSVEARVDHIDERVVGFTMPEAAFDAACIHLDDEVLELIASQLTIAVDIALVESSRDFSHESFESFRVSLEGVLKFLALLDLLFRER